MAAVTDEIIVVSVKRIIERQDRGLTTYSHDVLLSQKFKYTDYEHVSTLFGAIQSLMIAYEMSEDDMRAALLTVAAGKEYNND